MLASSDRTEDYVAAMESNVVEPAAELLADLAELLRDCPPLDHDPIRATGLASAILAPAQDPEADPEIALLLPDTLEQLDADRAVPLLSRVAELARPVAATAARAALDRLAGAGVAVPQLAPLEVIEAWRVQSPAAEAFAFDLGRGDGVESRVFVLLDRREDPAGVVVAGCAGGPCEGETLERIVPDDFDGGSEPERIPATELARALNAGCERAAAADRRISAELAVALTVAARPVLGDPEALAVLAVDPEDVTFDEPDPDLLVDPIEDENRTATTIESLLEEYEHDYLPLLPAGDPPDRHRTDLFVAHTMLSYKAQYADGQLADWPVGELAEFMLYWWPRKVTADQDAELTAPASISRFLGFLHARDSLSGSNPKRLRSAITELLEPFLDACDDPANWGPAKTLVKKAASSGADIHDREALETYLAETYGRAPSVPAGAAIARSRAHRRTRRKAVKKSRRRNRG